MSFELDTDWTLLYPWKNNLRQFPSWLHSYHSKVQWDSNLISSCIAHRDKTAAGDAEVKLNQESLPMELAMASSIGTPKEDAFYNAPRRNRRIKT